MQSERLYPPFFRPFSALVANMRVFSICFSILFHFPFKSPRFLQQISMCIPCYTESTAKSNKGGKTKGRTKWTQRKMTVSHGACKRMGSIPSYVCGERKEMRCFAILSPSAMRLPSGIRSTRNTRMPKDTRWERSLTFQATEIQQKAFAACLSDLGSRRFPWKRFTRICIRPRSPHREPKSCNQSSTPSTPPAPARRRIHPRPAASVKKRAA